MSPRPESIVILILSCVATPGITGCGVFPMRDDKDLATFVRGEDRLVSKRVSSWEDIKQKNVVMQDHEYTCGAAAVATLMRYYFEDDVTEQQILKVIEEQMSKDEWAEKFTSGLSVRDLMRGARSKEFGYEAEARELTLSDLIQLTAPVIVHLDDGEFQHFVVYRGIVEDRVYLADPILGNIRMPVHEFKDVWSGVAVALSKEEVDPGDDHALAVDKTRTSRPELQAARRSLFLTP